jgi:single-stranded-DNA-specific exonuclease
MPCRLDLPPVPGTALRTLERELGVAPVVAQVLARRGLTDPAAAAAFLAAGERHAAGTIAGMQEAVALVREHLARGSQITVHGDYDVDGVCATAILVRGLRALGGAPDWFLPSRTEDGYGLSRTTVDRLAARGTRLLITCDCAITAVDEVAHARALGLDVVVTDHHSPRADGALPDAPIVHPGLGGAPCPDLCGAATAHKLAEALGAPTVAEDLDLVALATVADCVPLLGENRRLVREGLQALGTTRKPGLRALAQVSRADLARVDAGTIGFRLAPRINAAGRLTHADAALELLLTEDADRAQRVAAELDRANGERRHTEQRILFEAEGQVAAFGDQPAYVLAGEGWHPGVIGIVASRIAERHHRPVVLLALDGAGRGTGSGRSIPAFDLLGGLDACAAHLLRHGGHRAAAGCTIDAAQVDAFRAAFVAHAAATLSEEDLVPVQRVDAVAAGDELGLELAEALETLGPFGVGNPEVRLLVPAARLVDARPMGEGKHLRCTVLSGGVRARAVLFGRGALPPEACDPVDAVVSLERNEWQGAVEPRLVLRECVPCDPPAVELLEPEPGTPSWLAAVLAHAGAHASPETHGDEPPGGVAQGAPVARLGSGQAGLLRALVATGEPVLAVGLDAPALAARLRARVGGFAVASWDGLEADPGLRSGFRHVVALEPPPRPALASWTTVLAWGDPELRYAGDVLQRDLELRPALAAVFRALRDHGPDGLAGALDGWPAPAAGRAVRVLVELGLVEAAGLHAVAGAARTELERSATFRAARARHDEARAWLSSATRRAA